MKLLRALSHYLSPSCRIPEDLDSVTSRGVEDEPEASKVGPREIEGLWRRTEELYRTGLHPAVQLCIRHNDRVVLNRAIGHSAGNAPQDPPDAPKIPLTVDTPMNIFSASKAVTAMVVHKLDEQNVLRLDDHVCDFIPEFARYGKERITLRHVLSHRAGVPNLPPEAIDLDNLQRPDRVLEILCNAKLQSRPGRVLAYHAVTGGFILAEVVKRATGRDIRTVLEEEISRPLGLSWLSYGVKPEDVDQVALNALTGPPLPPPLSTILHRAIGVTFPKAVEISNDPRFLTGIIPSANVITTAHELSAFYQCLLDHGERRGTRVFEPRTVRYATAEQSFWEIDFTLIFPIRYSLGFMLGNQRVGPLGIDNPHAFGHVGLSNIFTWADPERGLSVALITTGKPVLGSHVIPLFALLGEIGLVFSREAAAPRYGHTQRPTYANSTGLLH